MAVPLDDLRFSSTTPGFHHGMMPLISFTASKGMTTAMKSFRIDRDLLVTELVTEEGTEGDWMTDEIIWADLPYDDRNLIIYDDEAFEKPGLAFVCIGANARVPVPAYIIGFKGEKRIDSDLDASDIKVGLS